MRRLSLTLATTGVALAGLSLFAGPAYAWHAPITLCHATDSRTNPYVKITVDIASTAFAGHEGHLGPIFSSQLPKGTKWGDIIPPKSDNGQFSVTPRNWNGEGQTLLRNGCNFPHPTTTTTTTEPEQTTTTTEPQVTTTTLEPTTTTTVLIPPITATTTPGKPLRPQTFSAPPPAPPSTLPFTGAGDGILGGIGAALVAGGAALAWRRGKRTHD